MIEVIEEEGEPASFRILQRQQVQRTTRASTPAPVRPD